MRFDHKEVCAKTQCYGFSMHCFSIDVSNRYGSISTRIELLPVDGERFMAWVRE